MDFSLPATLAPTLDTVRAFVHDRLYPLERLFGERGSFRAILPEVNAARAEVKKLGLWAPQLPKEWGGMGLTLMEHARVSEELGRTPIGHYVFGCQAPDAGNMELLMQFGTAEQKERWLRPLAAGEIRSCFAMTEPERAGSNPTWLDTTARKDGSDYVIDGHKWFATGADGAKFAIVMAVTNPDQPEHARASQIIVPMDTPGLELVRNVSVMGHSGDDWVSHAELRFRGVRVPQTNRLGDEGAGFLLAQDRLGPGRIHHAMRWIGICERAFEMLCTRAATREIAPGKPLGTRQIIQEWIAESRAGIHASRLMILHAAWKMEREGSYAAREEISLLKFFVADVLQKTVDRAVQAHGALGITDDTPLASFYRFERAARIYDGADEVHKSAVARRILRGYGLKAQ
ncbi:MAG TPA: acyl-CoA dehydrogenase family protein [Polyangiaceae bacterium]|nr:acyl-CoA dehydrogenase family protein [Polyangiaceae bacterium]